MKFENRKIHFAGLVLAWLVFVNLSVISAAFIYNNSWYWLLMLTIPLLGIAIYDATQKRHTIKHKYPLFGRVLVKYSAASRHGNKKRSGTRYIRYMNVTKNGH